MSAPERRWSVIGAWVALACITFLAVDSMAARNWSLLLVFGVVPPLMLMWLWKESRLRLIGTLNQRKA